ncbi:hypothetical protein ANN_19626 [Periplaneta americana]|uniref:Uncharacterized protein n=1 Tax=Periplaneta americana TaxID=6978 RepID=A0ABQ8SAT5_PERAM|nr:hypothetical protein ANN_19626 [Periplaneta americana]
MASVYGSCTYRREAAGGFNKWTTVRLGDRGSAAPWDRWRLGESWNRRRRVYLAKNAVHPREVETDAIDLRRLQRNITGRRKGVPSTQCRRFDIPVLKSCKSCAHNRSVQPRQKGDRIRRNVRDEKQLTSSMRWWLIIRTSQGELPATQECTTVQSMAQLVKSAQRAKLRSPGFDSRWSIETIEQPAAGTAIQETGRAAASWQARYMTSGRKAPRQEAGRVSLIHLLDRYLLSSVMCSVPVPELIYTQSISYWRIKVKQWTAFATRA